MVVARLALIVAVLAIWQWVAQIPGVIRWAPIFDPFFISAPSRIAAKFWELATTAGDQGAVLKSGNLFVQLWATLWATLLGFVVGVGSGFLAGLVLSQWGTMADILHPYLVAFNALPRIALVPLLIMIFGTGLLAKVVLAWLIVFFIVFFNTYAGGRYPAARDVGLDHRGRGGRVRGGGPGPGLHHHGGARPAGGHRSVRGSPHPVRARGRADPPRCPARAAAAPLAAGARGPRERRGVVMAPPPSRLDPVIVVREVTRRFTHGTAGAFTALDRVSFEVAAGEFLAIVGPSGCGKSTLLNIVAGLKRPDGGTVSVNGRDTTGATPREMGYLFQEDTVLPWFSVERNIGLGLEYRGVPPAEARPRVTWALEAAGLTEFRASYPHQLSGGMRRRVALMMTLVVDPKILLMDEPFGALDTHTKTRLHASLLEIWEKTRQTIIFVTHDLMEAITLSDRVIIMSGRPGRVKASYPIRIPRPRDVIKMKDSEEYLGDFREIWRILGEEFV
jgi:NitT/TauT family transport system ATP-binding protein